MRVFRTRPHHQLLAIAEYAEVDHAVLVVVQRGCLILEILERSIRQLLGRCHLDGALLASATLMLESFPSVLGLSLGLVLLVLDYAVLLDTFGHWISLQRPLSQLLVVRMPQHLELD